MLPRLWGEGRFDSVDEATLEYIRDLGATHVWYTGIPRHASGRSFVKGSPGSPYAVSDWYDVNPYLAKDPDVRMSEWLALIDRTHRAGLKLIVDFIPNHVARDYGILRAAPDRDYLGDGDDTTRAVSDGNDFYYCPGQALKLPVKDSDWQEFPAKASGNSDSPAPDVNDWYDTIKINYGHSHTRTWDRMLEVACFWLDMGIDGLRMDMVDLVPMPFLSWLCSRLHERYPGVLLIAETYRKDLYDSYIHKAGMDLLYDKEGMYNSIRAIYAKNCGSSPEGGPEVWQSARQLTAGWQYLGSLQPHMLGFLENHDEQRLASGFFAGDASRGIPALCFAALFNNASLLLYFGQEVGESASESGDGRTSIFNIVHPEGLCALWRHIHGLEALRQERARLLASYREILHLALSGLCNGGTIYDLCWCNTLSAGFDPERHFAWLRSSSEEKMLFVCNFSPWAADMQIAVPEHAATMTGVPEQVLHVLTPPFGVSFIPL